jgi:transposase
MLHDSNIPVCFKTVAGLDVHNEQITATIIHTADDGSTTHETLEFSTFKSGIRKLAAWILENKVEETVMESTGIYWRSPYDLLANQGVSCFVVNARFVKMLEGHKTDVEDSQWLAMLARSNLLRKSFVPSREMADLRALARLRQKNVNSTTAVKNRIHKFLCDVGFRVSTVVTDITGRTGRIILDDLLAGFLPATILGHIKNTVGYKLKAKQEDFLLALEGEMSNVSKFCLKELLDGLDSLVSARARMEAMLFASLKRFEPELRLLETIPGVSHIAAAILLVEIGGDITQFRNSDALSSWAGMCPGNNESAGKRKSSRTLKANVYLRRILCEIAHAAVKTQCYYKEKFNTLQLRRGRKRAIFAIGHKILVTVYHMLTRLEPYKDKTVDLQQLMVKKNAPRWVKMLLQYDIAKNEGGKIVIS